MEPDPMDQMMKRFDDRNTATAEPMTDKQDTSREAVEAALKELRHFAKKQPVIGATLILMGADDTFTALLNERDDLQAQLEAAEVALAREKACRDQLEEDYGTLLKTYHTQDSK